MTFICDAPEDFASEALLGFSAIYADYVQQVEGGVVRATQTPQGKAVLVVGGGSGHYPAFIGFVGHGMADAAVAGDVFASPSAHSIAHVARLAHQGGGILLGFGNYAGDVMNFGLAAERLISEGFDVRLLAVTDDVASAPIEKRNERRGVAGDLAVFKIVGAAAESGASLEKIEKIAQHANARTASFGVAFTGCTLPGAKEALFTVPKGLMGVGLGVHGEAGISEEKIMSASALADLLVERLLREKPQNANGKVAAILNGLGSTKYEELFVLWGKVENALKKAGLTLIAPIVGEFVTSLDMTGCSLSLTWLDDVLESLWLAPVNTPVLQRGGTQQTKFIPKINEAQKAPLSIPEASKASQDNAQCLVKIMKNIAEGLRQAENELGALDARAGDGDHGQGMSRGAQAGFLAAVEAAKKGAGFATTLAIVGDAWADRAGGSSGALWGLALRTWSVSLSDTEALNEKMLAQGARAALEALKRLGKAQVGDKTMVDAFEPFVIALEKAVNEGLALKNAWIEATLCATNAAENTAQLTPKLGRAKSHVERSLGHPDAGAISFALCARIVQNTL